mgnify:CR=1 FL=1
MTEAARDSVTGEYITQMELAEITVVARSKQVAERTGKSILTLSSRFRAS